ncbi:MAG: hypothetical protein R3E94_08650 [Burkholderiaceae bacterium]
MPVWLQNTEAWLAIGISLLFVVAGVVMHRVIKKVLRSSPPKEASHHEQ